MEKKEILSYDQYYYRNVTSEKVVEQSKKDIKQVYVNFNDHIEVKRNKPKLNVKKTISWNKVLWKTILGVLQRCRKNITQTDLMKRCNVESSKKIKMNESDDVYILSS
jgi:hypothetical protein